MESQAKKAKHSPSSDQLPSILADLKGETLDSAVLAAIEVPSARSLRLQRRSRRSHGQGGAPTVDDDDPHGETHRATIDKLFAEHVGKSPGDVVGNAIRSAKEELHREGDIFNKKQTDSYHGHERQQWTNHPLNRDIKGPKTDGKVWLAMLLGNERAEEGLRGTVKMDSDEFLHSPREGKKSKSPSEAAVVRLLETEASKLPSLDILANILFYVREESRKGASPADLLRFSVVYGLDGVMSDVLRGRYGAADGLDINMLLPLFNEPIDERRMTFSNFGKMFLPAYAIAAILGHENVVVAALMRLGGNFDAPYGTQKEEGDDVKEFMNHTVPSHVFLWVFMKNMPSMIKCLVNDCGFQFRWIDHEMMLTIHRRIFDSEEYESFPKWTDVGPIDLMWVGGSRARCRLRAGAAYKKQMEMLDLLISLGFPFNLFFDAEKLDDLIDLEEKLIKEKKLESREQGKAYMRGMDRDVRKARETLYYACCTYNSMQSSESDNDEEEKEAENSKTLTLGDYYRKLKSQWGRQESVQADRLPEFEVLDYRWRKTLPQNSSEEENESDSYRDSDDGSSYGDPPGYW